jgi:peptidoglycan/xylan/chitin deacetylase (PgdA/CDA1 family)
MSKIISVMYHYVHDDDGSKLRYLHTEDFKKQLHFLESNFGGILSGEDWIRAKRGEDVSGVLLTFDDGLKDHRETVLPILKELGLFGLFFICTDPIERGSALNVHLAHKLLASTSSRTTLDFFIQHLPPSAILAIQSDLALNAYKNQSDLEATKSVKKIINYISSHHGQHDLLRELWAKELNEEFDEFVSGWYLNDQDVRALVSAGMGVGSHTCSHRILSSLRTEEIDFELTKSKNLLAEISGTEVTDFCFPFGGPASYDRRVISSLENSGFEVAHSVDPRAIDLQSFKAPFELPRYDCNEFPFGTAHSLKELTEEP